MSSLRSRRWASLTISTAWWWVRRAPTATRITMKAKWISTTFASSGAALTASAISQVRRRCCPQPTTRTRKTWQVWTVATNWLLSSRRNCRSNRSKSRRLNWSDKSKLARSALIIAISRSKTKKMHRNCKLKRKIRFRLWNRGQIRSNCHQCFLGRQAWPQSGQT